MVLLKWGHWNHLALLNTSLNKHCVSTSTMIIMLGPLCSVIEILIVVTDFYGFSKNLLATQWFMQSCDRALLSNILF